MRSIVVLALIVALNSNSSSAAKAREGSGAVQSSSPAGQEEIKALRSDLQRMKALVQQMESNLAFVDTTQSPLKHQFQLEIDMWKTVIGEMERKINAAGVH